VLCIAAKEEIGEWRILEGEWGIGESWGERRRGEKAKSDKARGWKGEEVNWRLSEKGRTFAAQFNDNSKWQK